MFEINLNNKTALIFGFSNHRSIAWHTANVLKSSVKKENRIVFREISKGAIVEALKTPRTINNR